MTKDKANCDILKSVIDEVTALDAPHDDMQVVGEAVSSSNVAETSAYSVLATVDQPAIVDTDQGNSQEQEAAEAKISDNIDSHLDDQNHLELKNKLKSFTAESGTDAVLYEEPSIP